MGVGESVRVPRGERKAGQAPGNLCVCMCVCVKIEYNVM